MFLKERDAGGDPLDDDDEEDTAPECELAFVRFGIESKERDGDGVGLGGCCCCC